MKRILPLMLGLLPLAGLAADLKIGAGESYLVSKDSAQLVIDHLEIGDAAHIRFAPGVAAWRVQAKTASIGDGVVIDGRGEMGAAGVGGVSASDCANQISGQAGAHGAPGGDGVSMRLQLGLQSLGSLKIISSGGAGGAGGSGGDGADNRDDCAGEKGGDGGAGGDGGPGGNAGDVTVLYRVLGGKLEPLDVAQRIKIEANAGAGGNGGRGGSGGSGSGGYYITKKTLTGSRQWVSGGESGLSGSVGQSGEPGREGGVMVDSLMVAAAPAPAVPSRATSEIEKRLESLERRVKALESAR
ncbi:hypothetical protein GCM10027567_01060 [Spongiibacter taiwanensis]|uniref:hypothetical protein n=1 Tax=Spongiibacter taiwanensis TaxID=1748242 RepID=UPI00255358A8|nr:hypothetical protein [Spongiibacter taiwanensis]